MNDSPLRNGRMITRANGCAAFFVLLFLLAGPAQAQQVRVHLSADSVTVGERFTLSLAAEHAPSLRARFPDPLRGDTLLGDLRVIARTDTSHRLRTGTRIDSARYEVTTFALDTAYVPPLPVRLASSQDTTLALSPATALPVRSLVPEDASDIQALAPLAPFPRPWWHWALAAASLIALLGAGYYAWHRYRRQPESPPSDSSDVQPPVPPYEAAQRRLRKLAEHTDLSAPDAIKPFYVELIDTVRRYLKRRLGVTAQELPSSELLRALDEQVQRGQLPEEAHAKLRRVFHRADYAKFAEVHPPAHVSREVLSEARDALRAIEERQRELEQPRLSSDGEDEEPKQTEPNASPSHSSET